MVFVPDAASQHLNVRVIKKLKNHTNIKLNSCSSDLEPLGSSPADRYRARQDSNLQPSDSKSVTISN